MSSDILDPAHGKMRAFAEELVANPTTSLRGAMLKSGYAPATAQQPTAIVKGPSFQALLQQYLPQDKILRRHGELIETDNENVALGAVKLAHQVRGNLASDGASFTQLNVKFEGAPQTYETPEGEVLDVETGVDELLDG